MNPITTFIKRYPQGVFWGIAYLVSGGGYTLSPNVSEQTSGLL